ncbi:MarR family winged helix-turn-helix transcriptional regulator [Xylocopilactobacillus apis]|uniref:MarR family transcriptional regulator n=1 Tax=Xylocopilactobacillus apis TaxID=2932183 RepID=A0AAU9DIH3_9LACO|nr:MarR family transcriptional regulator [Xylocopilactobacillus apis]BDR56577.1 MarR family transcriptional regulator [Xylocopilactobacillus apis]
MENNDYEIQHKLMHLQMLLKKWHMKNRMEHGPFSDPTFGQGRVLALLKMQDKISSKDLSFLLNIRPQSLNELLNKLEKAGYIERTPSEEDKRVILVHLTEEGRKASEEVAPVNKVFNSLNSEELNQFSDYLDRIISNLESEVGNDEDDEMRREWMLKARERFDDPRFEHMMHMHPHCGPHNFRWRDDYSFHYFHR